MQHESRKLKIDCNIPNTDFGIIDNPRIDRGTKLLQVDATIELNYGRFLNIYVGFMYNK